MKVNALVKRGSLYMQHEKVDDSLRDFDKAALLDPSNSDVFHHRGQVKVMLMTHTHTHVSMCNFAYLLLLHFRL